MDSNGWYISLFCLSRKIFVDISPCVVYHEQKWLVYHPVLSVMDKNGWNISYIFCRGQNWLVHQPDLSVVDNNGWYIGLFCLSWTILVGISPSFCPSWTKLVVILTGFVCHGQ